MPVFVGHHRTTGAGPSGLILASAPRVCAWATSFSPFLAKTGGSRRDFVTIYSFRPVRSHRRCIWVSVLASILLVLLQVGMSENLSLLVVQRAQHAAPPIGGSFSPGSTKISACSPTKAPLQLCGSLQQNVQLSLTQQRSRTH